MEVSDMDDIETKRGIISTVYESDSWQEKVRNMPDAQVIAVYMRFKREGKI